MQTSSKSLEASFRKMAETKKPRIVILGSGFGGIYTYLNLRKRLKKEEAEIIIISKSNYFLFTPLLHEVATGGLAHHQVVEAVRSIVHSTGATFHMASVDRIDTIKKTVETSIGPISYDYLVVATGSSTNFYNVTGAKENSYILKSLSDAISLRNTFIDVFEKASHVKDQKERQHLLSFVVVGGGATGVELAAEMVQLFFNTFRKYYDGSLLCRDMKIHVVANESELLHRFHPKMRTKAEKILKNKGVNVLLNKSVMSVDQNGVNLSGGQRIEAKHVIWTAGVKANVPESSNPFSIDAQGRLVIDETMEVKNHPKVYALGDVASFEDSIIPMHAQAAVQEAKIVAKNIIADIKGGNKVKFSYNPLGDLVSVGQWQAVGDFFGIQPSGPFTWFIWRTVYLFKFASWSKRIKIMIDWTIDIFYPRDITKA